MKIKDIWNSIDEDVWKIALKEYYNKNNERILNIENEITQHNRRSLSNLTPNEWLELLKIFFESIMLMFVF